MAVAKKRTCYTYTPADPGKKVSFMAADPGQANE